MNGEFKENLSIEKQQEQVEKEIIDGISSEAFIKEFLQFNKYQNWDEQEIFKKVLNKTPNFKTNFLNI